MIFMAFTRTRPPERTTHLGSNHIFKSSNFGLRTSDLMQSNSDSHGTRFYEHPWESPRSIRIRLRTEDSQFSGSRYQNPYDYGEIYLNDPQLEFSASYPELDDFSNGSEVQNNEYPVQFNESPIYHSPSRRISTRLNRSEEWGRGISPRETGAFTFGLERDVHINENEANVEENEEEDEIGYELRYYRQETAQEFNQDLNERRVYEPSLEEIKEPLSDDLDGSKAIKRQIDRLPVTMFFVKKAPKSQVICASKRKFSNEGEQPQKPLSNQPQEATVQPTSNETCAVCILDYKPGDFQRKLPCNHRFHKACVDKWLFIKNTCPVCKKMAIKSYSNPFY